MARVRVRVDSRGAALLAERGHEFAQRLTEQVFRDAVRLCPVDTHALADSIDYEVVGLVGRVTVDEPYWRFVEYPTAPHLIRSHGDYSLHNDEFGEYYGREVMHPGTQAQPFLRPALYRVRAS